MFKENSRIINKNGIVFDEEDILLSKYIHNNDINIKTNIKAQGEAFGFVFVPFDEQENGLSKYNYLIRMTSDRAEVLLNRESSSRTIEEQSLNIQKSDRLFVTCAKKGEKVSIIINEEEVFTTIIPNIDKYQFGIYSTQGNVLYNIDIKTPSPMNWNTNMKNTDGGFLKFIKNGFTLVGCNQHAEIIQDNVSGRKGFNYLKFESSSNSDIVPYLFLSKDKRTNDEEKNILKKVEDGLYSFYLEEESLVTIKFKGKNGTIKNISISMNLNDDFVSTIQDEFVPGSKLIVDMASVSSIFFQGVIKETPSNDNYFLLSNTQEEIKNHLPLKEEYAYMIFRSGGKYIFNIYEPIISSESPFETYINEVPLYSTRINQYSVLEIFYSIDAIISQFLYMTKNDEIIDVIKDKELVMYVENNSIAPIIVSANNRPLSLSGNFRIQDGRYIFTNTKRESFESQRLITLSKPISEESDIITIYGVNDEDIISKDKINHIGKIDNIDMFAKKYDTFSESDVVIDKNNKTIIFERHKEYDYIIIDYLLDESYTLNKIKGTNLYKIDISSKQSNIDIVYESKEYNSFNEGRKIIDYQSSNDSYISIEIDKEV